MSWRPGFFELSILFVVIMWREVHSSPVLRSFVFTPRQNAQPQLVLISGPTGTGKSTFGMSVALTQGILKCVSTDSVREVMRTWNENPALHRSSYSGHDDPLVQWKECCEVLDTPLNALVDDAIKRGVSLVLEGVHIVPSSLMLDRWRASGGTALGILLHITDEEAHRTLIFRRGEITRKGEEKKITAFERIRAIQAEMLRLAKDSDWLIIEQRLEPSPIDVVSDMLKSPAISID